MPLRWKIFAVANYAFLIGYGIFLFTWINFLSRDDGKVDIETILVTLVPSIFFLNSLLNIIVFHRYFPNKTFSGILKIIILFACGFFVSALILLLYGLYVEIKNINEYDDRRIYFIIISITILTAIFGFFILANQFALSRYLAKNNQIVINDAIEGIGKEE